MLECKGVVKQLGHPPAGGEWQIKYAKGIPFVADSTGKVKKWCMSVFQQDSCEAAEAARTPMDICIDKVTGDDSEDDAAPAPKNSHAQPAKLPATEPVKTTDPASTPRVGVKNLSGPTAWDQSRLKL